MWSGRLRFVAILVMALLVPQLVIYSVNGQISMPTSPSWTYSPVPDSEEYFSEAVVHENMAIVTTTAGEVVALEIGTGDVVWRHETSGDARVPVVISGERLIVAADIHIEALDIETGEQIWSFGGSANEESWAKPIIVESIVIVGTTASSQIHALDIETGGEVWRLSSEGSAVGDFAYAAGVVSYFDRFGILYGVSAVDGAPLWSMSPGSSEPGSGKGAVTSINDMFYVATNVGTLVTIEPMSGGVLADVWVAEANGVDDIVQIDESSFVVLYRQWFRDTQFATVAMLDINSLSGYWSIRIDELPTSNLVVDSESMFFGTIDGNIHALGLSDGAQQWAFNVSNPVYGLAFDDDAGLLASTSRGEVIRLKGSSEPMLCADVGVPSVDMELGATGSVIVIASEANIVAAPSSVAAVIESVSQCQVLEIGLARESDNGVSYAQVVAPASGRDGWIDIDAIQSVVLPE